MNKPKFFKDIDSKKKIYYCFELINGQYIIYDHEMRNPVKYSNFIGWGSIVIVQNLISMLDETNTVFYYKWNNINGMKRVEMAKPTPSKDIIKRSNGTDLNTVWNIIDPKERIYYYFKLQNGKIAIFDSEMGNPVMLNSVIKGYSYKSVTDVLITKLHPDCSVYYFDQLIDGSIKLLHVYTPKKQVKPIGDRKDQAKEESKKSNKNVIEKK